jgi:hypothetical protein
VARRLLTNQLKLKVDLESDRHKSCVHKQNKKGISLLAAKRQLEREKNEQLKGKKIKWKVCVSVAGCEIDVVPVNYVFYSLPATKNHHRGMTK